MDEIEKLIKKINFKKFPRITVLKLSFGFISLTTISLVIFRLQINKYLSNEGTNITQNIVESKELQTIVQNELNNLVKQIINDEQVQNNIVIMLDKLL
jgi:hypothetical protein